MIKNQWYAVLSSHELKKGKLLAARRFGENLLFMRNSNGEIGCFDSLCAHRKASLEKGWLEGDNIKCPFHGIEYDVTGKCVYIPSEGRASTLDFARFHLKSYPVREIGGIIFVWYGDKEPDKEPEVFDVITDKNYTYDHINDSWGVDYSRVIENQLDVSHLAFVHKTTIGRGNKSLCNGPKVVWLDDMTMQTSANNEVDAGQTPKAADECEIKSTNLTFKFPNMWLNHVTDKIMILAYFVPVDDEHSIISLRFYNRITGMRAIDKAIAWLGSRANKVVERQDKKIVETQLPKKTGTNIGENLVAADLPIIEYRTKRNQLQNVDTQRKTHDNRTVNIQSIKSDSKYMNFIIEDVIAGGLEMGSVGMTNNSVMNKKAMYKLSYGLFVLTTKVGDKDNGCITNTAIQVTSEPNRIAFAVNKANLTHDMLMESKVFNISILSEDASFDVFKRFGFQSGREVDKFEGYELDKDYKVAENGITYILDGTNSYISGTVFARLDLGTHTLFICDVTGMDVLTESPSATYDYYQSNIKPKPQDIAKGDVVGTVQKDETDAGQTVWRCLICGYEWVGEELPDDFICPICKHPKADFEKITK